MGSDQIDNSDFDYTNNRQLCAFEFQIAVMGQERTSVLDFIKAKKWIYEHNAMFLNNNSFWEGISTQIRDSRSGTQCKDNAFRDWSHLPLVWRRTNFLSLDGHTLWITCFRIGLVHNADRDQKSCRIEKAPKCTVSCQAREPREKETQ